MLYITTSGDLSALQLTTPTTTSVSVSVSLSSSLSHTHFDFALGPFPLFALLLNFSSHPLCVFIQCIYPCSCLSGCIYLYMCVCISLPDSICYIEAPSPPPLALPVVLPGCTCLVYQVRFSPCVCVCLKFPSSICLPPLSVCLLYLSAPLLLLQPKTALVAFLLLQLKSHTLVRLPSSNTKLCPARMSNHSSLTPIFLSPCVCFCGPLSLTLSFPCYFFIAVYISFTYRPLLFIFNTFSLFLSPQSGYLHM